MKITGSNNEASIIFYCQNIWLGTVDALRDMPFWERGFHVFWLLGPFILLIERSPADIWLSVIALTFVFKSIFQREKTWLRAIWVKACFAFLGVCAFCFPPSVCSPALKSDASHFLAAC